MEINFKVTITKDLDGKTVEELEDIIAHCLASYTGIEGQVDCDFTHNSTAIRKMAYLSDRGYE